MFRFISLYFLCIYCRFCGYVEVHIYCPIYISVYFKLIVTQVPMHCKNAVYLLPSIMFNVFDIIFYIFKFCVLIVVKVDFMTFVLTFILAFQMADPLPFYIFVFTSEIFSFIYFLISSYGLFSPLKEDILIFLVRMVLW